MTPRKAKGPEEVYTGRFSAPLREVLEMAKKGLASPTCPVQVVLSAFPLQNSNEPMLEELLATWWEKRGVNGPGPQEDGNRISAFPPQKKNGITAWEGSSPLK